MKALEAAIAVLREAGGPLHTREITRRILSQKLWEPKGKTPKATIEATLSSYLNKHGDDSPLARVAPSTYGLRQAHQPSTEQEQPSVVAEPDEPAYSFTEAAFNVLDQFAERQPMHYKDITAKALEMGWLRTSGKTPETSMNVLIFYEIKRSKKRGEQPQFVWHGRGKFGLSKWAPVDLASQIQQHNRKVRKALHETLLTMRPDEFEQLIARLLASLGFEDIVVTNRSRDGGIDVRGTLVVGETIRTQMAVQVKRWGPKHGVGSPIVQQVRGSLGTHEQGLIITTTCFSKSAVEEAGRHDAVPVGLMNGDQLVALLIENDICITRTSHDIIQLGEAQGADD